MPTEFMKLCICLRKFEQNLIKSKKRAKYFHIFFLNKLKKMYKKLKTVDFFNMLLFIFEIESFNFCICQIPTFA